MGDLLSTGVSGLLAFQNAINTTSHNISNSATVGYSRQTTEITARQADFTGSGWEGNGAQVSTITRAYSDTIAGQVRSSSSSVNQWDAYSTLADQVSNMFADSTTGLSASLQSFMDAYQNVADSPSSSAERQTLLSEAQSLVDQLKSYGTQLTDLSSQVSSDLDSEADTISALATSIANLNKEIAAVTSRGGDTPNDLLDKRDTLIDELSTHISVSTVKQSDGTVNVFIGSGQALVVGTKASELATEADPYDASRRTLVLKTSSGSVDVTDSMTGGTVGGLLNFQSEILDPAINTLGQLSVALASAVNSQQNAGMDLDGSLGADMFTVGAVQVAANTHNTGTGTVTVTRTDASALTTDNYVLKSTASGWVLQNDTDGSTVAMTGTGTSTDPLVGAGLSIVVGGTAATGDRFLIKPTSGAVSGMTLSLSDPDGIAAASPIIASASSTNTGNATIDEGVVVDASNSQLRTSVTIEFLSATTYTTDGGTTTSTYTAGDPIEINGWQVTISGTPAVGDTFTVEDNTGATGDNRNALLLADVLDQKLLNGGSTSLSDKVTTWVADIGVKANHAQTALDTQTSVYNDNVASQQSVSGVNVDEEAANLLRYQQAYQAAAQVIQIASSLFDSLLSAVEG